MHPTLLSLSFRVVESVSSPEYALLWQSEEVLSILLLVNEAESPAWGSTNAMQRAWDTTLRGLV